MSFDLDIDKYNSKELEELFGLVHPFSRNDVKLKANQLTVNIQGNLSVAPDLKKNTIDFIKRAEEKLYHLLENVAAVITTPTNNGQPSFFLPQLQYTEVELLAPDHDIIVKPQAPYNMSFPQEFQRGLLNPLERRVIRKILNIDTRFRDNYLQTTATNCALNIPFQITILNMQLTSIEIPNSYYVISRQYGNNYFSISAGDEKIIYVIPDGNYSNPDLVDFLNNYAVNNGYTSTSNPLLFYITFNVNIIGQAGSGSGQFVIGISPLHPGPLFHFTVNFNEDQNGNPDNSTPIIMKLGWLLGYREGIYINNSSYVSEGVIDLYGPRYLFLAINDYTNSVNGGFYSSFHDTFMTKNILARISIPNTFKENFNINNWNNMNVISYPRQYFGPINLGKIGIQLLNEYGTPVDLNNMDFSFCLSFECPYNL
jgi:hypothetical protein